MTCEGSYTTVQADVDASGVTNAAAATVGGTKSAAVSVRVPWVAPQGSDPRLTLGGASGTEDAGTLAFTVTLDPTSLQTVTVGYATANVTAAAGEDYTAATGTLTLAAGAATGAISVAVTDDAVDEDDETFTVTLSSPVNAAVASGSVTATISDNDTRGIALNPAALGVTEDGAASYTVALQSKPTGAVTVTVGGATGTDLSVSPVALTFSTTAWSTVQTVTVEADDDDDAVNDSVALTHTAGGGDYGAVSRNLTVTVTDTDTASTGITLAVAPAAVGESADATNVRVTGTLNHAPELTDTTVTVTVGATSDPATEGTDYGTVADLTLTIAAGASSGTATFTITPTGDEVDEEDETVTVGGTASGFTVTAATVTITDDDTRGIALNPAALGVTEDGAASYTVALQSKPTGAVTMTVGGTTNTDLSVSPVALTFSTTAWSTVQTVTVDAGDDDDAVNDSVALTHTAGGGDYGTVSRNLTVTVTDIDTAAPAMTVELGAPVHDDADGSGTVTLGDMLTYTATARNSGNVPLTGVALRDVLADSSGDGCGTLGIGASCQLSGDHTVSQADVDAGTVANTATGTASELTDAVTASVSTAVAQERAVTLVKTAAQEGFAAVGDRLDYSYEVSNSGTVTLTGTASVTDDKIAGAAINCPALPESGLAPGGTVTCEGSYTTVQADVDASGVTNAAAATVGGTKSAAVSVRVPWVAPQGSDPRLTLGGASGTEDAGTLAFTVTLDPTSLQTVTVGYATANVTATAGEDYTAATGTLTLAAGVATGAISVAVTDDAVDEDDETFTVTLSSPVNAAVASGSVTATISDNDTRGIALNPATLTVTENDEASYTVALQSEPTGAVTVTVGGATNTDLSVEPATLMFSTTAWSTAQTVTVDAGEDDDAVNDSVALTHTAAGGDYGAVSRNLTVTVTDIDTAAPAMTVELGAPVHDDADGSGTVTLGDMLTYTATARNSGNVPLTGVALRDVLVDSSGDECGTLGIGASCQLSGDHTVSQADVDAGTVANTATGTASELTDAVTASVSTAVAQERAVTLVKTAAQEGFAAVGDRLDYSYEVSNSGTVTLTGTASVSDDKIAGAAINCPALPESGLAPGGTVTCEGSYTTVQADVDASGVTNAAAATVGGTKSAAVSVRVPWVAPQGSDPRLTLGGASGTEDAGTLAFTVTLDPTSLQTVTVGYATANVTATAGEDYTAATGTLTLAAGAATGAISVAVTDDAVDEDDETFTVTLSSPVNAAVASGSVTATITDNDTRGIALNPAALTVTEDGEASYTVALQSEPTGAVTVTVGGATNTDLSVEPAALTFSTTAWSTVQTVTVDAGDDDDAVNDSVALTHTPALTDTTVTVTVGATSDPATEGTDYGTVADLTLTIEAGASSGTATFTITPTGDEVDEEDETVTVGGTASGFTVTAATVTITDDDTRGIALNPATLGVTENDEASYTVALQSKPTGAVTVTVGGATNTDLSVEPATLMFSTTAWSTAQTVTVDAGEDDDAVNDSVALTHTAGGGDYGAVSRNLTVTVTDIDTAAPAMTVELGAPVHDDADGSGTVTLGDMLTYTATARNSGNVPLTGVALRDVLVDSSGDECGTLGIGASCQLSGDHTVSQADVDAGTVANTATGTASELTDAVTASVSTAVAQERAVTLVKTAAQEGFAAVGDRLDYSYEVSNSGTVTLTGTASVSDDKIAGAAINCPALPESGLAPGGTVTCEGSYTTVQADVDASGVTNAATATVGGTKSAAVSVRVPWVAPQGSDPRLTLGGASGTEDAGTLAFTVTLDPTSLQTVTVGYATANVTATAGEDYTAATGTLTLAAGAATGAISVAVTDDAVDEDDETFTVTLSSPVNAAVASGSVTATITDNDTRGIALSPAALGVTEGGEASYTVALLSKPTGAVTVTVGGATGTDLSVSPVALTFSTTAWSTVQTVTVEADEDDDAVNDSVALTHTAGGGDYGTVSRNLTVTVTDIDTASTGITLAVTPATVGESADATNVRVTGTLNHAPALTDTTVTVTVGATSDPATEGTDYGTVADLTLTIEAGASSGTATFTITPTGDEVDEEDETVTVGGTASGFTVTAATVTITDDDTRGIALNPATLGVTENDEASYTVALQSEPTGAVTVTVGGATNTDLSVEPAALTFSTTAWSTVQTVTVDAGDDDDAVNDSVALTHTAGGGDYGTVSRNLTVTVTDTDTASTGITLAVAPAAVGESADATNVRVTGTLNHAPALTDTTVTVTVGATSDPATEGTDYGTVADLTLTIAAGASSGTATFTITPTGDEVDEEDETVTVGGTASGFTVTAATVTITDDDTRGIALNPATLTVTENDEASYTVALQSKPTGTVTVTVGGATNTDLSVEPATLMFSTTAWSTAQTVTVDAGDDDDAVNDSVALTHTAGGGDYGAVSRNLTVTVTDTDTASTGITLAVAPAAVGESADATNVRVTGTLNHAPELTDTTVTVTVGATSDAATEGTDYGTVADLTLTIAAGASSGTATFTITPTGDEVDEEDETVTVGGTASGFTVTAATVTITDDDTRGIALNPATLTVTENDEASYTVALQSEPTGTVTVTVGGTTNTDLSVEPAALTFSTTAWSTAQTVTVDAGEDDDAVNDSVALTHTAGGGDYGAVSRNLTVTVTDIDTASTGITLAVTPAAVGESADATNVRVTGTLNHAPALTDTTVTVTVGATSDAATEGTDYGTVADLTLTIAAGASSGTATFTITPTGDEVDEEDETVTVGGTVSGFTVTAATVTITDDDTRGIALNPATLGVTENDEAGYTVALQSEPTGTVTVTVGGTTNTDLSVEPAALTFSTTAWSTVQTVTVDAREDDDAVNDSVALTHTAAGGDYGAVSRNLTVTVTDIDTAAPAMTVELGAPVHDDADGSGTVTLGDMLTYTATARNSGNVPLTGVALRDVLVDSSGDECGTLGIGASCQLSGDHTVSQADVDAGTVANTATGTASELTDAVTASVSTAVAQERAVTLVKTAAQEGFAAVGDRLDYSYEVSNSGTVTLTGTASVSDDKIAGAAINCPALPESGLAPGGTVTCEGSYTTVQADVDASGVTNAATATVGGTKSAAVSVRVPWVAPQGSDPRLTLGGASGTEDAGTLAFTVTLDPTSLQTVTVGYATANVTAAAGEDYTAATGTLTLAAGAATGAISVAVTDDAVDEDDETFTVTLSSPVNAAVASGSVTATITDNDTRGIALNPAALTVTEDGEASYTVALQSKPTGAVTVTVGGTTNTDLSVEPAALTFSTTAWSTVQTVTVDAGEDDDAVNDSVALTHTAGGGDYGAVSRNLTVTVTDTDTASTGITLAVTPATVGESADATNVRVTGTLNHAPALTDTTVTVTVGESSDPATEGTDYGTVADLTLTIAAGASSGTATFTITPTGDEVDEEDETVTVGGTVSGFTVTAATVTITDDDTRGIALSPATLTVTEDDEASYTVALLSEPTGTVTVTVGGTTNTDLSVEPATLMFSTTAWSTAQTVTVDAGEDDDAVNDSVALTHTAGGGDYGMVSRELAVTVTDTDTASTGITLAAAPASVGESAAATSVTVTGTLNHAPALTDTTVTVTVGATSDPATEGTDYGTVADLTLTIAAGATSGTATFTITPTGDEVDEEDETVTVGGTASGFTVTAATVTITDDDTRGIVLSPAALTVTEDDSASYTVALQSEPTGEVTVTIGGTTGTDLSVAPTALTFRTTGWNSAQTVTIDAGDDDDAVNDSVALTHTAGGGDYGAVSRNLTVTVTDIDTASTGITLAVTPATVGESADATNVRVTGTLNHAPALTDTTVTVTVGATSDPATEGTDYGTVADLTLTIAAGASSGTASFTFTPVDDTVDETDETVTVGGTAAGVAVTAAALTIIDDDPGTPGSLTIDVEPSSVAEQAGSTPVTVTGTLSPPATQEVEVTVTVTGDTATEGADFAAVANFALTFAAGQASAAASFTLVPIADGVTERIETLKVVGTPSDVALSPIEAIVTITDGAPESDSEAPPTVSITGTGAVNEGQPVRFTVTRTGTATASLTVPVGVSEQGSFLAGAPAEEVRFAAGARSATLTVATADDETDEPDGSVTATLRAGSGYELGSASATVAVADNDDAPELSIADVRAVESAGMIEFTVHMAAASAFEVSVVCTSEDVTATANEDYEPELGTLVLAPGQTLGTIRVPIMDDMWDEMDETFMMLLSAPVNATLADDEATGTIVDDDESVAAAWLSRFGRTVASHVVDVVGSRLGPGPAPVSQAALAGRRLQSPPGPVPTDLLPVTWSEWEQPAETRRLEFAELLAGSAFDVVAATDGARNAPGGQWTAWGRGGVTHLAGADEHLAVEGQVAGALVGVEYDWGSILAGASAGYHDGRGRVELAGANGLAPYTEEVESWLVSVHPYVSVEVSDRVALWGLLGYGQGSMSLAGGGSSQETPITMTMGAVGGRGLLLSRAESERFRVALKADALLARMASDEAERLPAAMADAQRLRVVLEGSVDALRGPHGVLTPSLAVGARVDGGAAETGAGLEVGGGLSYAYPPWGLTVAADGRLLVAHEDRGFEQWGAGGSLRVAPGAQGVGPSLTLGTAWGDTTTQVEQLWSQGVGLAGGVDARNALGTSGSLAAELGYGLPAPASAVVTPFVGVALEESGSRTYRVGSRLNVGQSLRLALEAERHESGAAPSSKHVLKLTGTLIW